MNYDQYVQKTRQIISELAEELGNPKDEDSAWRVLGSVLHTLRDRLSVDESFNLISQLPMLLKALYVEGWHPARQSTKLKSVDDFIQAVRNADKVSAGRDFGNDEKARAQLAATFRVLKGHISAGQLTYVERSLPRELREFIEAA